MLTFGQAKQSNITTIAGVTAESDAFKGYINEAMERLMYRGDFDGLLTVGCFCIKAGCVVFPRYVESIREAVVCGQGHIDIKNQWYEFIGDNWINWRNQWGWGLGAGSGGFNNPWWNYSQCQSNMLGVGRVPTYDTIRGTARKVRVYPQVNEDFGKTVTIFGTDNNGQELVHRNENGDWRPGIVITMQAPYGETEGYVSHITRVLKERTQMPVSMFAYDTVNDVLENLAFYDPGEENPSFMRYSLNIPCYRNEDGEREFSQMTALVKLRYIPVEFDSDLIPLTMPALKLLIQGIRAEEGGDFQASEPFIAKAVRELNHVVQDRNPGNQISVNANPVGNLITSPI